MALDRLPCALVGALVLLSASGCALVVRGTEQSIRINAVSPEGKPIETLECRAGEGSEPGSAVSAQGLKVRRSVEDLLINCISQGQVVARARIVSRSDMGLISLAVGGVLSATIDHLSGAAYAYPDWIALVAGEDRVYDRRDSGDGPFRGMVAKPVAVASSAGTAMPVNRPPNFYRANFTVTTSQVQRAGTRRTGRDTYNVEKLAATTRCTATPRAVLVEQGAGYEVHQVPCSTGQELAFRCDFGMCRLLPAGVSASASTREPG